MMGKLYYLKEVVTLKLDTVLCTGCGMCVNVCPHEVFEVIDRKSVMRDRDACMECGACANNCKPGALTVRTGVGCASGIIRGTLTGTEACCGPSDDTTGSSCC